MERDGYKILDNVAVVPQSLFPFLTENRSSELASLARHASRFISAKPSDIDTTPFPTSVTHVLRNDS